MLQKELEKRFSDSIFLDLNYLFFHGGVPFPNNRWRCSLRHAWEQRGFMNAESGHAVPAGAEFFVFSRISLFLNVSGSAQR